MRASIGTRRCWCSRRASPTSSPRCVSVSRTISTSPCAAAGTASPGSAPATAGSSSTSELMKGIRVDERARTVTAQGGVTWGELDHETAAFGLATTGGLVSTTGIAGLTLGGGIGWLMRKHGLACDNLVGADVVDRRRTGRARKRHRSRGSVLGAAGRGRELRCGDLARVPAPSGGDGVRRHAPLPGRVCAPSPRVLRGVRAHRTRRAVLVARVRHRARHGRNRSGRTRTVGYRARTLLLRPGRRRRSRAAAVARSRAAGRRLRRGDAVHRAAEDVRRGLSPRTLVVHEVALRRRAHARRRGGAGRGRGGRAAPVGRSSTCTTWKARRHASRPTRRRSISETRATR